MDPNFEKCTVLAFYFIGLCACSSIFVTFLVIEVSPFVIERGMRSVGCLTSKFLPEASYETHRKKFSK